MDKSTDLHIFIDESAQSKGVFGTIFYSEIKTEVDSETSTDALLSQNGIEDRLIIGRTDKDLQLPGCSTDANVNGIIPRETDRKFQFEEKSVNVNELMSKETDEDFQLEGNSTHSIVNEVNEIGKGIQFGKSSVTGNASVSQNSISENNASTALEIVSAEYKLPMIKFTTLLKLKEKSSKEIIEYCIELGLIASKFTCPKCESIMILGKRSELRDGFSWFCRGYGTKFHRFKKISKSIRTGSFFSTSKVSLLDTLMIIHCWVYKIPIVWTALELDINRGTLLEWNDFCRDVCLEICAKDYSKIGGTGTIVEIEGDKYERRKNDENIKKNSFVFIGAEDMYGEKTFLRIAEKCDKNSFLEVIQSSVLPGSTVISKFFSKFKCRKDWDFVHLAKSCKYKFKDPKASDLSKRKNFWDVIRKRLPRHKTYGCFDHHIAEFLWRKRNNYAYDKMRRFLLDIKTIYPPPTID